MSNAGHAVEFKSLLLRLERITEIHHCPKDSTQIIQTFIYRKTISFARPFYNCGFGRVQWMKTLKI